MTQYSFIEVSPSASGLCTGAVALPASKSISNRILIMRALSQLPFEIHNLSEADDTRVLLHALSVLPDTIDVQHAGTALRFIVAFLAFRAQKQHIVTGSTRLCQRPIAPLVEALNALGARISYAGTYGYAPLVIHPAPPLQEHKTVSLRADVSSQFVTALLMIAPTLPRGLTIELSGQPVSWSYVRTTISMMNQLGISVQQTGRRLSVSPGVYHAEHYTVEPDWSAATYFLGLAAVSPGSEILLNDLPRYSIQPDSTTLKIFSRFGVSAHQLPQGLLLLGHSKAQLPAHHFDMLLTPDALQTVSFTAACLCRQVTFSGWQTLRVKETDRVAALQNELAKIGVKLSEEGDVLVQRGQADLGGVPVFETYNDHRMAMSAAILSALKPMRINDAGVVSKSFPYFWEQLRAVGLHILDLNAIKSPV